MPLKQFFMVFSKNTAFFKKIVEWNIFSIYLLSEEEKKGYTHFRRGFKEKVRMSEQRMTTDESIEGYVEFPSANGDREAIWDVEDRTKLLVMR